MLDALALQRRAAEQEDSPACRMDMAQILCQMGCYEESNRVLAGMLAEKDPPNDCYFGLSCNYVGMGQSELAYRAMVQFLARDPEAVSRTEVAQMFQNLMRARSAQENAHMSRGARRASNLALAAQVRQAQGELALAARLFKRAILALKGGPGGPLGAQLARVYSLQGEHALAADRADLVLRAGPVSDGMLSIAATVYARAGQRDKALCAIRRLERRKPQGRALQGLLDACCALGDDERVRLLAPKVLRDAPYDRRLLHQCAVNRVREGRPVEQAVSFWTRALRIDPGDMVARWGLKQAAAGKLDPAMPYDHALPPAEAQKWRRYLCQAQWLDDQALLERFHKSRALEDRCRWALYSGDRQATLLARHLLARLDDPAAQRLLSESLVLPGVAQAGAGRATVTPDVSTVRVPLLLRRAMKDALTAVQTRFEGVAYRVVQLTLFYVIQGKGHLPDDRAAVASALYFLATGDREGAPTIDQAAQVFGASPRRTARCAMMLGGQKEGDNDDEID